MNQIDIFEMLETILTYRANIIDQMVLNPFIFFFFPFHGVIAPPSHREREREMSREGKRCY